MMQQQTDLESIKQLGVNVIQVPEELVLRFLMKGAVHCMKNMTLSSGVMMGTF